MTQMSGVPPTDSVLPGRLDSETAALLGSFLRPIFDKACSWADLRAALDARGYGLEVREGRLVVVSSEEGRAVCTGRDIGEPLRMLVARLGRPQLRLGADRRSGWFA